MPCLSCYNLAKLSKGLYPFWGGVLEGHAVSCASKMCDSQGSEKQGCYSLEQWHDSGQMHAMCPSVIGYAKKHVTVASCG